MKSLHGIGMKWTNMDPTTISSGYQYDKEKEYNELRARRQNACRKLTSKCMCVFQKEDLETSFV
jgi:hypothetical protein